MKYVAILLSLCAFPASIHAEEIFRIEVGRNWKNYSTADLQRRVWSLERAVWQLQQRVFELEGKRSPEFEDPWICTISNIGSIYTGTGISRALAKAKAIENCRAANYGNGFFCREVSCEQ